MSIGIAIIAKNEEQNLPHLLASIDGAFDRAVLLDTGSTDDTIDVFATWAREQVGMTYSVAQWEWIDDFAAARNAADSLLLYGDTLAESRRETPMVDWRCWADCDDVLVGASNLRSVAENAGPEVTAFFAGYNYHQDPKTGQCIIYLRRERLVRATYTHPWIGRVHEATPITHGAVVNLPSEVVEWVHGKFKHQESDNSNERNIRILERWNAEEPGDPRIVGYLGTEHMVRGDLDTAILYFEQYNSLPNVQWDQEHSQVNRKLAQCHMMQEKPDRAIQAGLRGMQVDPDWPDSYLTLAEASFFKGEYEKGLKWARRAQVFGTPETMLIINPSDYTFLPKKLIALNLGSLGKIDEAVELGMECLNQVPHDQFLQQKVMEWRTLAKREHTANTFAMCAEQLIAHDEQLKAHTLLQSCVPVFAQDHPRIVALRSNLAERLQWVFDPGAFADHYETGGSKPEDFIPDDQIDALCNYLPRTNFLLEGLRDQLESA